MLLWSLSSTVFMNRFFFIILILLSHIVNAQKWVEVTHKFEQPDAVSYYNFDLEELNKWKLKVAKELRKQLELEDELFEVTILTKFYPKLKGRYSFFYSVELENEKREKIEKRIKGITVPPTRFARQSMFVFAIPDGEKGSIGRTSRNYPSGTTKLKEKLVSAGLEQQVWELKEWASKEAIPIFSRILGNLPDKMGGARRIGQLMSSVQFPAKDSVASFAEKNRFYWRGMLESKKGDQMMVCAKLLMHAASGEFDAVNLYLDEAILLSRKNNVAFYYLKELKWRMENIHKTLESRLEKTRNKVALGAGEEVLKNVNEIKEILPNNASILYLEFLARRNELDRKEKQLEVNEVWKGLRPKIFAFDKLYPANDFALGGKQGYKLFRRSEIEKLSKISETKEMLYRLANIGRDCEAYAYSSFLYLNLIKYYPDMKDTYENLELDFMNGLIQTSNDDVARYYNPALMKKALERKKALEVKMYLHPAFQYFDRRY